ncbi:hypothetical protein BTVI_110333 [Pitangus sulphuratus]|nr:hypothetical protein BTVI_110333 [Pitangus sulphuratus]
MVLKVWLHQCQVQEDDHCPGPAGLTISDTGQDAIGLLGHLGTLLARVQLAVNHHSQLGLKSPQEDLTRWSGKIFRDDPVIQTLKDGEFIGRAMNHKVIQESKNIFSSWITTSRTFLLESLLALH